MRFNRSPGDAIARHEHGAWSSAADITKLFQWLVCSSRRAQRTRRPARRNIGPVGAGALLEHGTGTHRQDTSLPRHASILTTSPNPGMDPLAGAGSTNADAERLLRRMPRAAGLALQRRNPDLPELLGSAVVSGSSEAGGPQGPAPRCPQRGSAHEQLRTAARQSLKGGSPRQPAHSRGTGTPMPVELRHGSTDKLLSVASHNSSDTDINHLSLGADTAGVWYQRRNA